MPGFNGSGVFELRHDFTADAAANIKIRADRMDAQFDDIADGLSNCITADGQTTVTADVPFAGYQITGLGGLDPSVTDTPTLGTTLLRWSANLHDVNVNGTFQVAHPTDLTVVGIGTDDTRAGMLRLYGNGAGNNEGGELRLYNSADFDTTYEFWFLDSSQGKFRVALPTLGAVIAGTQAGDAGIGTENPSTKLHVNGPARVGTYTVAAVPSASTVGAGTIIYVSNETGGAVLAFSDGTNWRRVTDRAVIVAA